ncbi:hypothetical protein RRK67_004081 [Vibrio fluvialis]|nr:hypothetical protein [Vibrio fluvialis]
MSLLDIRKAVQKSKISVKNERSNRASEYHQSEISGLRQSIADIAETIKHAKEHETVMCHMVSSDKNVKLLRSLLNNFLKIGTTYTQDQIESINNQVSIITKTEWKKYNLSKWGSNKITLCTEYKSIRPALIFESSEHGLTLKKITYFLVKESVIGL